MENWFYIRAENSVTCPVSILTVAVLAIKLISLIHEFIYSY